MPNLTNEKINNLNFKTIFCTYSFTHQNTDTCILQVYIYISFSFSISNYFVPPHAGREFRACIKAGPNFGGARVMVEGENSLIPLLADGDRLPLQVSSYGYKKLSFNKSS